MGEHIQTVVISPKYQIVIPREVREPMNLLPGVKLHIFHYQNRLEFVPVQDIKKKRGFLKGMNTVIKRDKECNLRAVIAS